MSTLKAYLNKETLFTLPTLGWVVSALVSFMMVMSGGSKLVGTQEMVGNFEFMTVDLEQLISIRNRLMESIDEFKRPLKPVKTPIDLDDCDDEEDAPIQEWTIKAEQPLTQSWTYTVSARSGCEAIKMIEDDPWQEGIVNNDDNEYYDYGEIEYETI